MDRVLLFFPFSYLRTIPATRNPKEAAAVNMYKQKKPLL